MTIAFTNNGFELNGTPFRVLSGAAHYFRSQPEQWPSLFQSLRAMGLNTVETYLAWNFHEPVEARWGRLDQITRFLDDAHEAGLHTIVRPGPYICAEWDNGGLPSWLTGRIGRTVRTHHPDFMSPVLRYLDRVVPLFSDHPSLLMVQIENEYGSYGSDSVYLEALASALVDRGVRVPLFTSDGPSDVMLTGGSIEPHLATVNFGSDATGAFATLRQLRPESAPFCMEFWCGWFDHWGKPRVTRDAEDAASALREILESGASVNLYMAHGGTNFGTGAGANHQVVDGVDDYLPTTTSYDYDAPLDERGAPTAKFHAFQRELRAAGAAANTPDLPDLPPLIAPISVELTRTAEVEFSLIADSPVPLSFEELGVDHGLVRYRAIIPGPRVPQPLMLENLRDRAHVYVDGVLRTIVERGAPSVVEDVPGPAELVIIVESMGRVNYGPRLGETKGIDAVRHGRQQVNNFSMSAHALPELPALSWSEGPVERAAGPAYFAGAVTLPEGADAYLDVSGLSKGYVWVNGFCLGRYWANGPQFALYIPWAVLREGMNEVTVLELDEIATSTLTLRPDPGAGHPPNHAPTAA